MHVVATAGHVDHGKSALVRALTGMEPDRWAEERRRGMTIDLGYAWTTLGSGETVAFVDVPGHERFMANMLAGVGPVPVVLFVVAADDGWRAQSSEHLAALDALGVRHALLAVTRSDLADPASAAADATARLRVTSVGKTTAVCVSSATGAGLDELRHELDALLTTVPPMTGDERTRLWVDRSFTVRGRGTVVTGTLHAGRIAVGDELSVGPTGRRVAVRGLESLKQTIACATAPARVAVNLRGIDVDEVRRGDALVTPGAWWPASEVDVRLHPAGPGSLPRRVALHVGSAGVTVAVRRLGEAVARLQLPVPLAVAPGDRGVLYDPGSRRVVAGVEVLDVAPPALTRRGSAAARAAELARTPDAESVVARDGAVRRSELVRRGLGPTRVPAAGIAHDRWLVSPEQLARWGAALRDLLLERVTTTPLDPGLPIATAVARIGLPDPALIDLVVAIARVRANGGVLSLDGAAAVLSAEQRAELDRMFARLDESPFEPATSASADLLRAAARAGELVRLDGDVYLRPEALDEAARRLRDVPQPFTVADARMALHAPRRVVVPVLERLDADGRTTRVDAAHRRVR